MPQSPPRRQAMKALEIHKLLRRRVLVTRESARTILPELAAALAEDSKNVAFDYCGVEGMTLSFF